MSNLRQLYKKQKEDLLQRHRDSVANKDTSQYGSIIDNNKLPEGIGFWKCTSASHVIDYIPFVAGSNMPKIFEGDKSKAIKEGDFIWAVDLWTHGRVGVLEHPYVCPTKTNGEPCPICEHLQQNRSSYSKEEYSKIKATRQTIHLIWCHDNSEEEAKGLQIWQIAHYFMEKNLKIIAERPKGGGTVPYFCPDNGKNVAFTKQGSDGKWTFLGHRFDDREGIIPDKILDQSFALDSVIKYATYDEIHQAFYGTSVNEQTPAESTSNTSFVDDPTPTVESDTTQESEIKPDECPANGEFGVDHTQLEACDDCVNWDNCYAAKQELESKSEPEPERSPLRTPTRKSETKPQPIRRPPRRK